MYQHECAEVHVWRSEDKLWELVFSWRSNPGCQAWQWVSLPIEPSCPGLSLIHIVWKNPSRSPSSIWWPGWPGKHNELLSD